MLTEFVVRKNEEKLLGDYLTNDMKSNIISFVSGSQSKNKYYAFSFFKTKDGSVVWSGMFLNNAYNVINSGADYAYSLKNNNFINISKEKN